MEELAGSWWVGEYKEKGQGLAKGNKLVSSLEETEGQDCRSRTMNSAPADLSDLLCCQPPPLTFDSSYSGLAVPELHMAHFSSRPFTCLCLECSTP